MHFIVWLLKCAESVAEKMPIGEFEGTETQLQKFDNSTNLEQWISYPKLFAAIVHGFGVDLFWCTALIQTGSNLTIEVLRRTLNKIEAEKGFLPPILHLQLDTASDNKSKQFLAFIAYLVENCVFHVVKLSYLIVAHTHEDVDQYIL